MVTHPQYLILGQKHLVGALTILVLATSLHTNAETIRVSDGCTREDFSACASCTLDIKWELSGKDATLCIQLQMLQPNGRYGTISTWEFSEGSGDVSADLPSGGEYRLIVTTTGQAAVSFDL